MLTGPESDVRPERFLLREIRTAPHDWRRRLAAETTAHVLDRLARDPDHPAPRCFA